MDAKKVKIMWSISLFIIGFTTFILAGANVVELKLSDIAVRILGMMDIVALPILGFSTIKIFKNRK